MCDWNIALHNQLTWYCSDWFTVLRPSPFPRRLLGFKTLWILSQFPIIHEHVPSSLKQELLYSLHGPNQPVRRHRHLAIGPGFPPEAIPITWKLTSMWELTSTFVNQPRLGFHSPHSTIPPLSPPSAQRTTLPWSSSCVPSGSGWSV